MKFKIAILVPIFILPFLSGFSQFSISHDSIYLESDETDVQMGPLKIYNDTDQDQTIVWEKTIHCISDDWIHIISDENISYLPHIVTAEFILEAQDSSYIYVNFLTQDTFSGMSIVELNLFENISPDDKQSCIFYWNTNTCTTSSKGNSWVNQKIRIFPNPAEETLFIAGSMEGLTFEIYNPLGILVVKKDQISDHNINISSWNPGNYFIVFRDRSGHFLGTKPFIKH